jgi:hypothetical protein
LKLKPLIYTSLVLLAPLFVKADTITLTTGTPGDDLLATPTGPSPNLNNILLTFSTLTDGTTYTTGVDALVQDGVTISSADGLTVEPFSTQSNPNFLADGGTGGDGDGTANITIMNSFGTSAIGVGIADSDDLGAFGDPNAAVPITIQALGLGGTDLGSAFIVTIPEDTVNPGNGYFVVEDSNPNIYGLQIIQSTITNESGLAIADVQVAPEPSSIAYLVGGIMALIGFSRLRKKA